MRQSLNRFMSFVLSREDGGEEPWTSTKFDAPTAYINAEYAVPFKRKRFMKRGWYSKEHGEAFRRAAVKALTKGPYVPRVQRCHFV